MDPDLIVLTERGLYCPAGDFHIDPTHAVDRAVITHAHADHARSGCRSYWCAAPGQRLLRERVGHGGRITALAYGQAVEFGRARVSLHPAGHVLGSAQVRVEVDGQVWVVSGDYKREADPSCAPFEVLPCDTFITESTFGLPEYRWPEPQQVAAEIFEWWQTCKADRLCAVLCCYALGKAQRILAELHRLGGTETVYLHSTMTRLVRLYREAGVAMLPTDAVGNQPNFFSWEGRLVLAPPGAAGTSWLKRFRTRSTAGYSLGFASGWMGANTAASGTRRWDRGFVLSDHADWPGLMRTIAQTGARRVLAMHGHAEHLIAALRSRGVDASALQTRSGRGLAGSRGAVESPA